MNHMHQHMRPALARSLNGPCTTPGATRVTLTVGDVEFDCEAEFEPAERGRWEDGPGYPAQAHIYVARVGGVDLLGMLCQDTVARLEDRALEYFGV